MKKQLLCHLGLLFFIHTVFCQHPESQWLIWNAQGKNGANASNQNNYSFPIGTDFSLTNVTAPNQSANSAARNDLFIIYDNYEHFNSRLAITGLSTFYTPTVSPTATKHYFRNTLGLGYNIKYGYLTNRYETDDPPRFVTAPAGKADPALPENNLPSTAPTTILSGNHELVYTKDFTLIIDNAAANNTKIDGDQGGTTYTLRFDGVQRVGSPSTLSTGNNFVDLRPVFGTSLTALSPVLPAPATAPGPGEQINITLGGTRYTYINFRPTANAPVQFPTLPNGDAQYEGVFTLLKNGLPIGNNHPEQLRASHDPNFLQVLRIDKESDNSHIVTYHLEFENTSTTAAATSLRAEIEFPPMFDLSDIKVRHFHSAGVGCGGDVSQSTSEANRYIFEFQEEDPIMKTPGSPQKSIGHFEFKVKVKPGFDVSSLDVSLKLDSTYVKFDGNPFLIQEFRDLAKCNTRVVTTAADGTSGPINPLETCKREICTPFNWMLLFIVLGILLLLFIIYLIRKNRSSAVPAS